MQNLRCHFPLFKVNIGFAREFAVEKRIFSRFKGNERLVLRNFAAKKGMVEKPIILRPLGPPIFTSTMFRCGLFTFVSINTVFVGTIIWSYENWRAAAKSWSTPRKRQSFRDRFNKAFEQIFGRCPQQSDIFWAICFVNLIVFIGNNSSRGPGFFRYFANSPYGPWPATSMLLSVFSHQLFFHMFLNMYVLHSFTQPLIRTLGMEQFLAVFLSGGIFSSFLSIMSKAARRSLVPSIGASGGVCAILGTFCMLQPTAELCVPFVVNVLPHSFTASSAIWFVFALELFGAVFLSMRSPIDHAAHLGGLMFGMYYGTDGKVMMQKTRQRLISTWRRLRRES